MAGACIYQHIELVNWSRMWVLMDEYKAHCCRCQSWRGGNVTFDWTSPSTQIHQTALFPYNPLNPFHWSPCMIWSNPRPVYNTICRSRPCTIHFESPSLYDINHQATTTTILSIRGVTIPIDLVSSATDSIRQCIVLFKSVPVPTSDVTVTTTVRLT